MIKKLNYIFVTLFYIGKFPKIPGSIASLITTIYLMFLFNYLYISPDIFLFFLVCTFILSIISINYYIKDKDNKDPKEIVIDEFIGQSIPISLYEISHGNYKEYSEKLIVYFLIFILFRIFDIIKPFPASYYDQNFKNGIGVVMDDVCAGLYVVALIVLYMVFIS